MKRSIRACAIVACILPACGTDMDDAVWRVAGEPRAPERLKAAAERIDAWLVAHNAVAREALQPGLDSAAVVSRLGRDDCVPPREVFDLYAWRNGMRADTDVPFLWYHRFMSVEDVRERRRTYANPALRVLLPLPADWFPLFEFEGEYYFTRCGAGGETAVIWHWSGEEPEVRVVFRSVTAMLETAAEWYERGAVWVADPAIGALDMDIHRVRAIHAERNPDTTFPYHVPGS